jgi:hypothetical protein
VGDSGGDEGRSQRVAVLQVAAVGALQVGEDVLHVTRPHRRVREQQDILGRKLHALVRVVQESIGLGPLLPPQRVTGAFERILNYLGHRVLVTSILEVCHLRRT